MMNVLWKCKCVFGCSVHGSPFRPAVHFTHTHTCAHTLIRDKWTDFVFVMTMAKPNQKLKLKIGRARPIDDHSTKGRENTTKNEE